MTHPIRLSEKAWSFVESRRGGMLHDDYVSMLIENVADLSGDETVMPEGIRIVDVIEAYRPGYGSGGEPDSVEVAAQVMEYLREAYHDKVPRPLFRKKCEERGLSHDEISQAERKLRQWLM